MAYMHWSKEMAEAVLALEQAFYSEGTFPLEEDGEADWAVHCSLPDKRRPLAVPEVAAAALKGIPIPPLLLEILEKEKPYDNNTVSVGSECAGGTGIV